MTVNRKRICFTAQRKAEIWDRWQPSKSMSSIGRLFNRDSSSIYSVLLLTGGIRAVPRTRSRLSLKLAEREETLSRPVANHSLRFIARRLRRAPSTICREVGRNGGPKHHRAATSDAKAWKRALRPKLCKLVGNENLCHMIPTKLDRKWSPQQIAA